MDILNIDEVETLIKEIKSREAVLKEFDKAPIKVSIRGGSLNIEITPVRNSIIPFEKLASVYAEGVRERLQSDLNELKDKLKFL